MNTHTTDRSAAGPADEAMLPLDPRALAELRQLDPTGSQHLMPRVLSTYLLSLARLLRQLQVAHAAADGPGMLLAAHTLKSPSASIGAVALARWCEQTESAVREDRLDVVPGLIAQLQAEGQRVDAAVRRLLSD